MSVSLLPAKSERASLTTYKPTRDEERFVDDAVAFVSMTAPFFSHILYSRMAIRYTKQVPWAATDAHSIFVNPQGCIAEGWGIEEMAFVIVHEIMHYVFADLLVGPKWLAEGKVWTGKVFLPYDHATMGRAMDYRINAAIIEAKIGKFPAIGCYDPSLSAKGMEDCVVIYEKLLARMAKDKGKGGFDQHLEPTEQQLDDEKRIGAHQRETAIAAAAQAAAAAGYGDMPAAIKRLIGEVLHPKVKWQDHLKATMARSAGKPKMDWRSLDRKMITRPVGGRIAYARRSKYGCGTVAIGWDTSGSTDRYTGTFFGTMADIVAELNPERLIVIRCDARVHGVDELANPKELTSLKKKLDDEGVGGGGGTRFAPVFECLDKMNVKPDMLVYLTDLMGSFPERAPQYPTIWATVRKGKPPFGTVVEVEL